MGKNPKAEGPCARFPVVPVIRPHNLVQDGTFPSDLGLRI